MKSRWLEVLICVGIGVVITAAVYGAVQILAEMAQ